VAEQCKRGPLDSSIEGDEPGRGYTLANFTHPAELVSAQNILSAYLQSVRLRLMLQHDVIDQIF
jgi:hypothetical protein